MPAVRCNSHAESRSLLRRCRNALSRASPLAREIASILIFKFVLLWAIWYAFFAHPQARHMQLDPFQVERQLLDPEPPAEPAHAKR